MVRRGLDLGKKVAIAGAAITSAPVVIPPLLLLSTIGAAFAFPFGVYFASYACTNKLMSSLLLPPHKRGDEWELELDDDDKSVEEEEEEAMKGGGEVQAIEPDASREEEEEEGITTMVGKEETTPVSSLLPPPRKRRRQQQQQQQQQGEHEIELWPPTVEEEEEENAKAKRIGVADEIEMWPQAVDERIVVEEATDSEMVPAALSTTTTTTTTTRVEEEEEVAELPRKKEREEEGEISTGGGEEAAMEEEEPMAAETWQPMEEAEEEVEKLDGSTDQYKRATEQPMEETTTTTMLSQRSGGGGHDVNPTLVSVECSGERSFEAEERRREMMTVTGGTSVAMEPSSLTSASETAPVVHSDDNKNMCVEYDSAIEQSAVGQNGDGGRVEAVILREHAVVREESVMGEAGKEEEGGNAAAAAAAASSVELTTIYNHSFVALEFSDFTSSPSSEYASATEDRVSGATDVESGTIAVVVAMEAMVHSDNEGFDSEQMIWEQINALRTIVGYKAPVQSTMGEELKALYLFTGVEPPVSLEDTSDILEVGNKLRFLKAVIGVK